MSDLMEKIRDIRGLRVGNIEHFDKYYLNELMESNNVSGVESHLYLSNHSKNTEHLIIGGYGDVHDVDGAGHTRKLHKASYVLHAFATKSNTELYQFSGTVKLSKDIKKIQSFIKHFAKDAGHIEAKPIVEDSQLFIASAEGNSMYADGIITNVSMKDSFYRGDITLHLMKHIGRGSKYVQREHIESHTSLRTDSIMFSQSIIGQDFRKKIQDSMNGISFSFNGSGLDYDSRNWLLLVENVD